MSTFDDLAREFQQAQRDAEQIGTASAREAAERARQALARHPVAEYARRTHARQTMGSRDGYRP